MIIKLRHRVKERICMHIRRSVENVLRNRIFLNRSNPLDYRDDDQIVRKCRKWRLLIVDLKIAWNICRWMLQNIILHTLLTQTWNLKMEADYTDDWKEEPSYSNATLSWVLIPPSILLIGVFPIILAPFSSTCEIAFGG